MSILSNKRSSNHQHCVVNQNDHVQQNRYHTQSCWTVKMSSMSWGRTTSWIVTIWPMNFIIEIVPLRREGRVSVYMKNWKLRHILLFPRSIINNFAKQIISLNSAPNLVLLTLISGKNSNIEKSAVFAILTSSKCITNTKFYIEYTISNLALKIFN